MITHESNPQEPNDSEPTQEFITSSNEATGRPGFMQPRWKLAGIDQEGAHHVLQDDDDIIYVIQDGEVVAREELDDWRAGRTITDWRSYVADRRGWKEFFLQIIDFHGAFENLGGKQ